jgi:hypothetical protein
VGTRPRPGVLGPARTHPALTAALRAGDLAPWPARELGERPDVPEEFAQALTLHAPTTRTVHGRRSRHHAFTHSDEHTCPRRPNAVDLLDTGALTVETFVDRASAADVLGDDTESWVIAAHLVREGSDVPLSLLATTATAAAGTRPDPTHPKEAAERDH